MKKPILMGDWYHSFVSVALIEYLDSKAVCERNGYLVHNSTFQGGHRDRSLGVLVTPHLQLKQRKINGLILLVGSLS